MNGWKQNLVRTYDGKLKVYNPITRQMEDFEGGAVPEYSSEDAGKVLTVSEAGELEWGEAGGSGGGVNMQDIPVIVENEDYFEFEDQRTQGEFMNDTPPFVNIADYGLLFIYGGNYTYIYSGTSLLEDSGKKYLPITLLLPQFSGGSNKMVFTSITYNFEVIESD